MLDFIRPALLAYIIFFRWIGIALGFFGRCVLFVVVSILFCSLTIGLIMTLVSYVILGHPLKGLIIGGEQLLLAALCLPVLYGLFATGQEKSKIVKQPAPVSVLPLTPYKKN